MQAAAQTLVDATSLGSLYALTALGIGLIFGVMRLINFAHGDLITIGGYAMLLFYSPVRRAGHSRRGGGRGRCSRCSSSASPSARCAAPIPARCWSPRSR